MNRDTRKDSKITDDADGHRGQTARAGQTAVDEAAEGMERTVRGPMDGHGAKSPGPSSRRAHRRSVTRKGLAYLCVFAIVAVLVATSGAKIIGLKMDAASAKTELAASEAQKASLEKELAGVNDPSYIEDQARDKLRMIKKGETLYVYLTHKGDSPN